MAESIYLCTGYFMSKQRTCEGKLQQSIYYWFKTISAFKYIQCEELSRPCYSRIPKFILKICRQAKGTGAL